MIVLDASVTLKWAIAEDGSDKAARILDLLVTGELRAVIPDLLLYEMTNALRLRTGFAPATVQRYLARLSGLGIEIVEPTPELMGNAIRLARRYDTSAYDAAYLALALDRRCQLVTADAHFAGATGVSGACVVLSDFERA